MIMTHSQFVAEVQRRIAISEGSSGTVYTDTTGNPTIGIGYNLNRSDAASAMRLIGTDIVDVLAGTVTLTQAQIAKLFAYSFAPIENQARASLDPLHYDGLSDARRFVVCDLVYNLGEQGWLDFVNTRAMLDAACHTKMTTLNAALAHRQFGAVADALMASAWYSQVGDRAKRDVAMMRSSLWVDAEGDGSDAPPIALLSPSSSSAATKKITISIPKVALPKVSIKLPVVHPAVTRTALVTGASAVIANYSVLKDTLPHAVAATVALVSIAVAAVGQTIVPGQAKADAKPVTIEATPPAVKPVVPRSIATVGNLSVQIHSDSATQPQAVDATDHSSATTVVAASSLPLASNNNKEYSMSLSGIIKTALTNVVNAHASDVPALLKLVEGENGPAVTLAVAEADKLIAAANIPLPFSGALKGELEAELASQEPAIEAALVAEETAGAARLVPFLLAQIAKIPD
jgi:GH24 family phage-related lysozyme (muramidase)